MIPFVIAAFILLFIVVAVIGTMQAKKRRADLLAWATQHGLQFTPDKRRDFEREYSQFKCLHSGDQNRYAYNLCHGKWADRDVITFDYHYETTSRDSKGRRTTTSHHFSGAMIRSSIPLKPLHIRPEHLFDKLAGFFGYEDINFESAEFSRKFHVASPDRKWAYDVLPARTIEFLLSQPRYNIQFDRDMVLCWGGGTWKVPEFETAINLIEGIFDRMPEYVVQQQKELAQQGM